MKKTKGRCRDCNRELRLRKDGKIPLHGTNMEQPCAGAERKPELEVILCDNCKAGQRAQRFQCWLCREWTCLHLCSDRIQRQALCNACAETKGGHLIFSHRPEYVIFHEKHGETVCSLAKFDSWEEVCLGMVQRRDRDGYFVTEEPVKPADPTPLPDLDKLPKEVQRAWLRSKSDYRRDLEDYDRDVKEWRMMAVIRKGDSPDARHAARRIIEMRYDLEYERFTLDRFDTFEVE